jgi:prepilin-type N-terminal cleavage/methylation domain-containing protein
VKTDRSGFTLVEIIIAASILAVVAMILFESFTSVLTIGQGAASLAETRQTARFIIRKLTEDLRAFDLFTHNDNGLFLGIDHRFGDRDADRIRFTGFTRQTILFGGSDQAYVEWYVVEKEDDPEGLYTLWRSENQFVTAPPSEEVDTLHALDVTSSLVSFNIRYMVMGQFIDAFHPETLRKGLPTLVEVTFGLEDEEGRQSTYLTLITIGGQRA